MGGRHITLSLLNTAELIIINSIRINIKENYILNDT